MRFYFVGVEYKTMSYTLTAGTNGPVAGGSYLATSANTQIMISAVSNEYLYLGNAYGTTWTTTLGTINNQTRNWQGVTISADGA